MIIRERLDLLNQRIADARKRAGRTDEVKLVLVTKEVDEARIQEALAAGAHIFGENKVQDLLRKKETLGSEIEWHFIGHLQTNKAKKVVGETALIHSCDRLDLAEELNRTAEKQQATVPVLLQVNTSGEVTKGGFQPHEVAEIAGEISKLSRLAVQGLMTIGPNVDEEGKVRASFQMLRRLRDELKRQFPKSDWRYLSMGMSHDFEWAIEEGANLIRVGSFVFGERPKKI